MKECQLGVKKNHRCIYINKCNNFASSCNGTLKCRFYVVSLPERLLDFSFFLLGRQSSTKSFRSSPSSASLPLSLALVLASPVLVLVASNWDRALETAPPTACWRDLMSIPGSCFFFFL